MYDELHDLAEAVENLLKAEALSLAGGLLEVTWLAYISLVMTKQARGDGSVALRYVDLADPISPRIPLGAGDGGHRPDVDPTLPGPAGAGLPLRTAAVGAGAGPPLPRGAGGAALHTAKKHVANLLGKLGAANRTQAVARGRQCIYLFLPR
jgi:hypothetical protein